MPSFPPRPPSRRGLLRRGAAGLGVAALGSTSGAPALAHGNNRPTLTHGIQLGDPRPDGAVVWTRADRPARMVVEVSDTPDFANPRTVRGPQLTPASDGTGRVRITGLAPGQRAHLRVRAESGRYTSAATHGTFRTAGGDSDTIRFLWSGDVAGQGWGSNPDLGGMPIFTAMADRDPDFFLHSGDVCYSDAPLQESVTLPDGRVWRNVVTEAKAAPAETLDQFRGQFAYNLLDDPLRDFAARVPQIVQWDDHEVVNNWYPGETLPSDSGYTQRDVDVLASRAHRAFHEWQPIVPAETVDGRIYRALSYGPDLDVFVIDMRPYRDANADGTAPSRSILGTTQAEWLVSALAASTATWKVVASDMPLGLVVPDGDDVEGVANGLPGRPRGRESELATVLRGLHRHGVSDVVWLTADVHYTAAHHYSPDRASVPDFSPFWEFVSGPLHAGGFGPSELDPTFGPRQVFAHGPPRQNASPMEGGQHFGEVEIDRASKDLTVHLRDGNGDALWSRTLRPGSGAG